MRATVAIWRRVLGVRALLLALLAGSGLGAFHIGGAWGAALGFGIAATQAGLVALLSMRLDHADRLVRLAAARGLFWLAILFALTLTDTLSRLANS